MILQQKERIDELTSGPKGIRRKGQPSTTKEVRANPDALDWAGNGHNGRRLLPPAGVDSCVPKLFSHRQSGDVSDS